MREELKPLRFAVAASFAGGEVPDEALLARIDEELTAYGRSKHLSIEEKAACRKELFDSFRGMDILQKALDDEEVTEIMVNGLEGIWLEKGSRIIRWERGFEDKETLEEVIQLMAASVNRLVNTTTPIADLRLPDGMIIAAIQRDRSVVVPKGSSLLKEGDVLVIGAEHFKDDWNIDLKVIVLRRQSPWNGAAIRDLDISRQTIIVMIRRSGTMLVPNGDLVLHEGDEVLLYTKSHISNALNVRL